MAFSVPETVDLVKYSLFGVGARVIQLGIMSKEINPLRYKPLCYIYLIGFAVSLFTLGHNVVKRNDDLLLRRLTALLEQRAQRIALFGEQRPELPEFQGAKRGKFFELLDDYAKSGQ